MLEVTKLVTPLDINALLNTLLPIIMLVLIISMLTSAMKGLTA